MQKLAVLFAIFACVAMIEAFPRTQLRYRPHARYQQFQRYNPRYAQYNRYRPVRLEAEPEGLPEADLPVEVFADEPVAGLPQVPTFPVDVPAVQEPFPAEFDVPLSASPDESFDHETRLLPEPEYRAAAPAPAPASSGSWFPLRFDGGLNGGTVAVANSYSTGNNGKSDSRAVAFGNPEAAKRYRRRH